MPTSTPSQMETIVRLIIAADPRSALDIGVGFGKYGMLMREYLEVWNGQGEYGQWRRRIEGIEAFPKYLSPVHDYVYDRVHIGDALDVLPKLESRFDLILLIDVIEHFSTERGNLLLAECERIGRNVLIATPRRFFEQGAVFENPFETHRSEWTKRALAGDQGFCIRSSDSLIALRGENAKRVRDEYRKRLLKDRCKSLFPFSARLYSRIVGPRTNRAGDAQVHHSAH